MKICITGKPCSGKSLAMQFIKEQGYNTWSADEWVHDSYKVGRIGYKTIKKHFGDKYVTKKEVNRKELGSLVFKNKKALNKLNSLINPLIKKAIVNLDKRENWFIELATYIFYPQDFAKIFDKIVLIVNEQNWKKDTQKQKFSYLKKIPTIFVENSKNLNSSILYIDIGKHKKVPLNVDFFVNNSKTKNFLKKNILKICKTLI